MEERNFQPQYLTASQLLHSLFLITMGLSTSYFCMKHHVRVHYTHHLLQVIHTNYLHHFSTYLRSLGE